MRFTKRRGLIRPFVGCILAWLSACVSVAFSPTSPVPDPLSEKDAMQAELHSQYWMLLRMACLSSAAYVNEDHYSDFCQRWTHGPNTRIDSTEIDLSDFFGKPYKSYYIVWTDNLYKQQVVAIRGTDDVQDWEANLLFEPVPDEILKVAVHQGFSTYARKVYDSLTVTRALNPGYHTYFTGHSLGGAVAVLTGLYLYVQEPARFSIKGVYTFGQPRVFDTRGATSWPAFASNVYHVENCYDPVPLVPISYNVLHSFILDPLDAEVARRQYQHLGHEILLMRSPQYWMSYGSDIVRNLWSDLVVTYRDIRAGSQIDHSIGAYINRIWGLRGESINTAPIPVNPAFEFSNHCVPYSLQSNLTPS